MTLSTSKTFLLNREKLDFIQSMLKNIKVHWKMNHWTVLKRYSNKSREIIDIWSFKSKSYPYGRIVN